MRRTRRLVTCHHPPRRSGTDGRGDDGLPRGRHGLTFVDAPFPARRKIPNLVDRGLLRRHPHVARDVHRLRIEEADIGDTDEAEDCADQAEEQEQDADVEQVAAPAKRAAAQQLRRIALPGVLVAIEAGRLYSNIFFRMKLVTLVFTDVQGSTKLWEQAPDLARTCLRAHDAVPAHAGLRVR